MPESELPGVNAFDLDALAEENPDFPVVTFDNTPYPDEVLTYADLVLKGRKLARAMEKRGYNTGDTFSVLMRNHAEMIIAMYAASALSAIMVPIDPRSKGDKLSYQLKNSNSRGVIFSSEFMDNISDALSRLPKVGTIGVVYKDEFGVPVVPDQPDISEVFEGPEVPAFSSDEHVQTDCNMIIYTSGTTGDPKGVRLYNRIAATGRMMQSMWRYTLEDRLYTGLSLTHGNAQSVTLAPSLALGIPSVISRRFTKSRIWDICRKHECTSFSLLGGMMMGIYSEPAKPGDGDNPVRLVLSAGTPRPIWEAFEERFNVTIHEWYGAVEGGLAHNPPGEGPIGSFGSINGQLYEMRVVREDDTDCGAGEIGELISRAPGVTPKVSYHGNKGASDAKTKGGWLRSGDMVHRDEDGWLYFDFRKGGGLRRQGDFIMPEYVEAAIARHPDVTDICVFGIPAASGAPGESDLVAAFVPAGSAPPDIKSVFDLCLDKLERNSVPSYLWVVDVIPKTASQKNLSRVLKDEFEADAAGVYRSGEYG